MTLQGSRSVLDFAVSRFARLYPAFWVSVLLTTTIAVSYPLPNQIVTLGQVFVNLTMLQSYLGVPAVEPVYWSLTFELSFYVLVAIVFGYGLIRRIELFCIGWVALSIALFKISGIGGYLPWRLSAALCLPYASLFFAGILYYKTWSEGVTPSRVVLLVCCYLDSIIDTHLIGVTVCMTGIFIVFSTCVAGYGKWFKSRPLVFLGGISYSLYLVHDTMGRRLIVLGDSLGLSASVSAIVAIALVLITATAITFFVERPANRALNSPLTKCGFDQAGSSAITITGTAKPSSDATTRIIAAVCPV